MSILSRLRALVSPPNPVRGWGALLPIPQLPDGMRLSSEQALQVAAVWACVRLISETVAAMPVNVVSVDTSGRKIKQPADPVAYLLNVRPNGYSTAQSFREALAASVLLHGNGYAEIVRDDGRRIVELRYMFAERTQVITNINSLGDAPPDLLAEGGIYYRYTDLDGGIKYLPSTDVLHFRGLSLDSLVGACIVTLAARAIAAAQAQDKYTVNYFANSAVPSGLLTAPPGKKVTDEDRQAITAKLKKNHGGGQQFDPIVLESGTTWTPLSQDAEKAQLVESRQYSVEDIARFFGVPLPLLQVRQAAQGYGTNLQELFLGWVRVGLAPWVKRFEQELTAKLAPRGPRYFQLSTDHLTRGTAQDQAAADQIRIDSGVLSVNEARDAAGYDGIGPEGDLHLVKNTLTILDEENLRFDTRQPQVAPPVSEPGAATNDQEPAQEAAREAALAGLARKVESRVAARVKDLLAQGAKPEEVAANLAADVAKQLGVSRG